VSRVDVITCHIEADFDALASILAAHRLYPDAKVFFPGSQEKPLREFKAAGHLPPLPVIGPRALDPGAIRRIIVVDTRRSDRIGALGEVAARPGVELHVYDHHPPGPDDLRGAVDVSRPVGANTTLMLHLLAERGIPIAPEEATLYLLGLYQETGCLTYAGTTPEDAEAAALCLRRGADLEIVARFLPRDLAAAQVAILDDLLRTATRIDVHGVPVHVAQASSDAYVEGLGDIVSRAAATLPARALLALARMEDRVFVVGRARDPAVDCAAVLRRLGGGGHRAAAAATMKGVTLFEARDRLIEALRATVTPAARARDCMHEPAITVDARAPIAQAAERLGDGPIDVLPVMREERVVGLIERGTVERALRHGLGQARVEEYMTGEFLAFSPDDAVDALERAMAEGHQRLAPILDRGRLVGVVTRRDLVGLPRETEERELLPTPSSEDEAATLPRARHRSVRALMRERLPGPIVDLLRALGETAAEAGVRAYAVGGFARDLLLGQEDYDLDIVVEGDAIRFAEAFAARAGGRLRRHEMFGTAVIVLPRRPELPGGEREFRIDVATARRESYARPGALPSVERSSLKRDLFRRDFTINTLAIRLDPAGFGELLDFFGGQRDLKDRQIRVLHALSFVEDPTRAFRALRFEGRLHFRPCKLTERLLRRAAAHLDAVSGPRILNEMLPILEEPRAGAILRRMDELGMLAALHPALHVDEACERRLDRASEALSWFRLLYTGERIVAWLPLWLALTARLAEPEARALEARLGITGRTAERLAASRRGAREAPRSLAPLAEGKDLAPSAVARRLEGLPVEGLMWLMAQETSDAARRAISRHLVLWRHVRPALSGAHVIALGVPEGPAVGEALRDLRDARLDGRVTSRAQEEARVRARRVDRAGDPR